MRTYLPIPSCKSGFVQNRLLTIPWSYSQCTVGKFQRRKRYASETGNYQDRRRSSPKSEQHHNQGKTNHGFTSDIDGPVLRRSSGIVCHKKENNERVISREHPHTVVVDSSDAPRPLLLQAAGTVLCDARPVEADVLHLLVSKATFAVVETFRMMCQFHEMA